MRKRGVRFLHAPVFMSPDMARHSQGMLMSSGAEDIFNAAREPLSQMTGEAWYMGHDPGRAASYKLFGNSMLFVITAGLADVFAMAKNLGLSPSDAIEVFSKFQPAADQFRREDGLRRFFRHVRTAMARKDIRLISRPPARSG
jgi:3-hydroxyisobutyrate dehydrogenase